MFVWKTIERRTNKERHGKGLNGAEDHYTGLFLFGLIPLFVVRERTWTGCF